MVEEARNPRNPRTREVALREIRERLVAAVAGRESVLVGFDFPYGYPAGFASALGLSGLPWRVTWELLRDQIRDDQETLYQNNRFEVAAGLNIRLGGSGPFRSK